MELSMRNNILRLSMATVLTAGAGTAMAQNLDVNFTANVLETTCQMKLVGGTGSDTSQTLTIGNNNLHIEDIKNKSSNAQAAFQIKMVECPQSLTQLKTTLTGDVSGYNASLIKNGLSGSGASGQSGVGIAREEDASETLIKPGEDGNLTWTAAERSAGELKLVAAIRETTTSPGITAGNFSAKATFNFEYQ
ncbi:fimbrial protein [Enterobacter pseudoroggenkampii]|uniref:fimbrial protein n=1 Tax=Enterobacter pseudoroggenkampii TaxID=2996112 RepID=UPI000462FA8A|nr:fimbrial protein [Enterobacter pseudoroggenkampii]MCX8290011.1 fimbrial protein [Enterobacter pseudoroggenkampii]